MQSLTRYEALIRIFQSVEYKHVQLSVSVPCKAPSFPASVLWWRQHLALSLPHILPSSARLLLLGS